MIAIPQKLVLPKMIASHPKQRSHSPKMIAFLKFNQQDNGNLTFKSPSNRTFTSQSDRVLNFEFM